MIVVYILALLALAGASYLVGQLRGQNTAFFLAGLGLVMLLALPMGALIVLLGSLCIVPIGLLGYDFNTQKTRPIHHNFYLAEGGTMLALAAGMTAFIIMERQGGESVLTAETLDGMPWLIGMAYFFGVALIMSYSARIKPFL